MQSHVATDVRPADSALTKKERGVERAARDDDELRVHFERHARLACLLIQKSSANAPRAAAANIDFFDERVRPNLRAVLPRVGPKKKDRRSSSRDSGNRTMQRDAPRQPLVLRRTLFIGMPIFVAPSTNNSVERDRIASGTISA